MTINPPRIYKLHPASTFRPLPRKQRLFSSMPNILCDGWESIGWALSPSRLLERFSTVKLHPSDLARLRRTASNLRVWNLLSFPSDTLTERFISICSQRSPTTLEAVSISMPAALPKPLRMQAIGQNLSGSSQYIFEVQMTRFVAGGVFFANYHPNTDLAGLKLCRLSQTLKPSAGMLVPTSQLLHVLGGLMTKECALFAIHCVKELRQFVGVGPMETEPNGGAA